ncbi:bifunctional diguanylate cyclase/phosphodiesterase [Halomonas sp. HP20-15]|uniref:putative bifunctional diguanylate cyclase/phosphodiesterase n=1 Tax=Halomonas sp. HP20-15 TaxID=3085901 RepID=UPI00298114DE|nr:bifunctional diguanylate cyclase/phosphodiesterase [Halomonas sp. HP20-15]MDW5375721.1 bifunctional diguanylate cyclase/phosphodiesterase [Halomonas sp. HP20-15]
MSRTHRRPSHRLVHGVASAFNVGLRRHLGLGLLKLALATGKAADRLLAGSDDPDRYPVPGAQRPAHLRTLQAWLQARKAGLQATDIDPLTGIGTRQAALGEIDRLIEHSENFVLLRMSVNNLKTINQHLGNDVGDQLLVALAQRLLQLQFHRGRVYRLGGDEFLMLVAHPANPAQLHERLRQVLCQPLELEGTSLIPSLSLSALNYPEHGQEARRLLRRSGIALSLARQAHDGYRAYQEGLDHRYDLERQLLRDMVLAVRDDQLRVVYQPKIHIADGRIAGFEALLQWQHPQLGLLQPDTFLPLAVASGHMALLGDWMLQQVITQMAEWAAQGRPQHIAANLSAVDLEDAQLSQRIAGWLAERNVDPRLLMLEVTEQSMMREPALAAHLLGELREMGIQIAIDDFGTGYSSLTQLRRLPLDVLKIDKSFVLELPNQPDDALIVDATIVLAHRFGLQVIAEGVESQRHLALLAEAGCDQAQGFLISAALDADAVLGWLDDNPAPAGRSAAGS